MAMRFGSVIAGVMLPLPARVERLRLGIGRTAGVTGDRRSSASIAA
jgi:hypothetical protein